MLLLSPVQPNIEIECRHIETTPFPFPVRLHSVHICATLIVSCHSHLHLSPSFCPTPSRLSRVERVESREDHTVTYHVAWHLTRSYCRQLPASTSRRVSQVDGREVRSAASTSDAAARREVGRRGRAQHGCVSGGEERAARKQQVACTTAVPAVGSSRSYGGRRGVSSSTINGRASERERVTNGRNDRDRDRDVDG